MYNIQIIGNNVTVGVAPEETKHHYHLHTGNIVSHMYTICKLVNSSWTGYKVKGKIKCEALVQEVNVNTVCFVVFCLNGKGCTTIRLTC